MNANLCPGCCHYRIGGVGHCYMFAGAPVVKCLQFIPLPILINEVKL